jgi:hypothetical protein
MNQFYGTNFVNIGPIPADRTTAKLFSENIRAVTITDDEGTSFDDLPMMADIQDGSDIDLLFGGQQAIEDYKLVHGTTIMVAQSSQTIFKAVYYALISAGHIKAGLAGLVGAAEYEVLLQQPGKASQYMFGIVVAALFGIALIAYTNVRYLIRRSRGQETLYIGRGTDRHFKEEK